jgi:hypothetical protein
MESKSSFFFRANAILTSPCCPSPNSKCTTFPIVVPRYYVWHHWSPQSTHRVCLIRCWVFNWCRSSCRSRSISVPDITFRKQNQPISSL